MSILRISTSTIEIESVDAAPFFYTLCDRFESGQTIQATVESLTTDQDIALLFSSTSFQAIRNQFDRLIVSLENRNKIEKQIYTALDQLYTWSLYNSSTKIELKNLNDQLPELQEKLDKSNQIRQKIHNVISSAKVFLQTSKINKTSKPTTINEALKQIDSYLQNLGKFHYLKSFLNEDRNQRVIDLAKGLEKNEDPETYPAVITDYPPLLKELNQLKGHFKNIDEIIPQLIQRKAALGQLLFSPQVANPLQEEFLTDFCKPFYQAAATHFYTLFPDADEELSFSFFNKTWETHLPEYDITDWIVASLKTLDPAPLQELETTLRKCQQEIQKIDLDGKIRKDEKLALQLPYEIKMEKVCFNALKSDLKTIEDLKNFLKERIKK